MYRDAILLSRFPRIIMWLSPWSAQRVPKNPTCYPIFFRYPTRFKFESHWVAGNPKFMALPHNLSKVSGITRHFSHSQKWLEILFITPWQPWVVVGASFTKYPYPTTRPNPILKNPTPWALSPCQSKKIKESVWYPSWSISYNYHYSTIMKYLYYYFWQSVCMVWAAIGVISPI